MRPRTGRAVVVLGAFVSCLGWAGAAHAGAGAGLAAYNKGKAAFEKGDLRAAADWFNKAFAAEPSAVYRYSEASCFRRLGENAKAATLYEEYLRLVPPGAGAPPERAKAVAYAADLRLAVGLAFKKAGDCASAIVELNRALGHAPRAAAWFYVGECMETMRDTASARAAYEQALAAPDVDAALRGTVEARLRSLKEPAEGPPATSPALAPPDPDEPKAFNPVPVIVLGGGVGLVAVVVLVVVVVTSGGGGGVDLPPTDLGPMTLRGW